MSKTELVIDNKRPDDDTYPTSEPAEMINGVIYVDEGQYIVDRDGDIRIATTSNKKWEPDTPLASWNRGFIRAKYIGNEDDSLEYTNQCRIATEEEIANAKSWTKSEFSYRIDNRGQLLLV
jgi:hypothetical protein